MPLVEAIKRGFFGARETYTKQMQGNHQSESIFVNQLLVNGNAL